MHAVTTRSYDPGEIRAVGAKVGGLSSGFTSAADGITGIQGSGAFGKLPSSEAIAGKLKSFGTSLQQEFKAGGQLATSTAKTITDAAKGMDDTEDVNAHTFRGPRAH
jgi:hypothetical protein